MEDNQLYLEDIKKVAEDINLNFENFKNKKILITGATGLICSFLVDVLMYRNENYNDNITIYMISRNEEKIKERYKKYKLEKLSNNNSENLIYIIQDVCTPFNFDINFDYIIHGASNTHPLMYSTDPVGTITTNVMGLDNLLKYSINYNTKRVFLMSSVEIYGENDGSINEFCESDFGYINCNTLRAGYPESKRVCEALCQAYISKYNLDIVIGRFSRIYGPTMQMQDSKAIAQFIKNAVNGEDIVLKSEGNQYYSYCYVADAVGAMLKIIFDGTNGEAYNISDKNSDITLKDLAKILASYNNKEVVFQLPDEKERKGYSTATLAIMNSEKLKKIGWNAHYDMKNGLERTIEIIKSRKISK